MSTANITKEILGQKLTELMDRKQVKQVALAEAVGVAQSAISNYKRGLRMPPIEEAVKIAEHLGVTLNQLFGWQAGVEQVGEATKVADLFVGFLLEKPENAQQAFNEYIELFARVRKSAEQLARDVDELETKTRLLWDRRSQPAHGGGSKTNLEKREVEQAAREGGDAAVADYETQQQRAGGARGRTSPRRRRRRGTSQKANVPGGPESADPK